MSFSTKILLGLIAGIAVGLFFGESVHHLEIFADGFVNLLRMTVLPYITVSLIFNLGRMDARQARLLALRGGAILAALWALSILVSFLFPFAFPYVERASFFSTTLVEAREQFNFIELYIPANPFHSLANNIVPAVVLFSVLLGIAIMQLEEKTPLLKVLNVADQAISQVTRFVFRLTPYGLFAVAAVASGTLRMTEIERIEVYLLTYVALALVMALWILPGLVSAITPIGYRDVLGPTRDALITAFLVGELFIVLPMLTEASKEILARKKITEKEDSELPDIIIPTAFNFPHTAKLLSLSFVLFAAWFTDVNLRLSEYPGLALSGFLSFFGSLTAAIPFLLDLFRIPADTFQIFLATSVINARFGSLLAAVHILVVALLGTTALVKKISFNPFRIGRYLLITSLLLASTVIGLRMLFTFQLDHEFDGRQLVLDMDSFYPKVKSRFVEELPSMASGKEDANTVLQAVFSRDLLRVGVLPERIPFSFRNSNKELVGFDIELIHRMARDLEVEVEFSPLELEQLATALSKGQLDVAVGGILVTPERAVETFFTKPYLEETLAFVVRDDLRDKFTSWEKIRSQENLTVGAEDAPYYVREVLERAPSLNIQILPPGKDFFDPDMHLDVMIMPAESGSVLTLLHPQYTVVVPEDQLVKVPVAFAVGRNDLAWEMWLNTWIHLKEEDGTLETLYRHWILGLGAEERTPRWSIARNLLGWGMP